MADVERMWAGWAVRAAGGDPDTGPLAHTAEDHISGSHLTAHSHSLPSLVRQVQDARAYALECIAAIPDDALGRTGQTHFGELTVVQMLRALYRHERMHLDQITGQESSFAPRRSQA